MKKFFFTALSLFVLLATSNAQPPKPAPPSPPAPPLHAEMGQPAMSKEQKEKMKKMRAEQLIASYKEAGLSEEQMKKAQEAEDLASAQNRELKSDVKLTEEEKKAKKDAINKGKNEKMKEIMAEKYKTWSDIRKKQRQAQMAAEGGTKPE